MTEGSKKSIYAAFVANIVIAIVKFIAAALTGSSAMFSEGIHTTVDTGNQILLLMGMKKAERPADSHHPFGYGKEIYFWSFIVAILVFALGAGVSIYKGIHNILDPQEIEDVIINYIVLGLGIIVTGISLYVAFREFNRQRGERGFFEAVHKEKNPVNFVVIFEDSAAIISLFTAIIGITLSEWTGMTIFDSLASIIIGVILGTTATWLAYETKGLLIGESADAEIVGSIAEIAKEYPEIVQVNETLTMHMGPNYILVNLSVDFDDSLSADKIEKAIAHLTGDIKKRYSRVERVFVEAEEPAQKG